MTPTKHDAVPLDDVVQVIAQRTFLPKDDPRTTTNGVLDVTVVTASGQVFHRFFNGLQWGEWENLGAPAAL